MTKLIVAVLGAAVLFLGAPASELRAQAAERQEVEFTAQVVDLACYTLHDARGEDHRMCAQTCADRGTSLVLLDGEGRLYHPVGQAMPSSGDEENQRLRPHAERRINVRGTVVERGGLRTIVIAEVSEET